MNETHFRKGLIDTLSEFLTTRDEDELFIELRYTYVEELLNHEPFRREFAQWELQRIRSFRDWVVTEGVWQPSELVSEVQRLLDLLQSNES